MEMSLDNEVNADILPYTIQLVLKHMMNQYQKLKGRGSQTKSLIKTH